MEVVNLIKRRDEKGLSMLYDHYSAALLGIIFKIVNHDETAEEVLQETFLKVWNNIDQFNVKRGTMFTWMATIARNKAIDMIRLKGFKRSVGLDEIEERSQSVMPNEATMDAQRLLAKLTPVQQEILNLIYIQGHTQSKTAELLKLPIGTVKTKVRASLLALRQELKGEKKLFLGSLLLIILTIWSLWM